MKAIASSIRQFDQGNAVSNLQQALTFLGFFISNDEQIASFFGDTTSNALRRFQESFQIPATDRVDENTANTLNEALRHKHCLIKTFE